MHAKAEAVMDEKAVTRQHLLDSTCEALLAQEMPRFDLQRSRLNISGILAGGYSVVTTIRGATFRFTAILYKAETTYLVSIERHVQGEWTALCAETHDGSVVPDLHRQFLGFVLSVIAADPSVGSIEFAAALDDQTQRDFYHTAVLYLARRLQATYRMQEFSYNLGYTLILPHRESGHVETL
jgi:hypothetical protein